MEHCGPRYPVRTWPGDAATLQRLHLNGVGMTAAGLKELLAYTLEGVSGGGALTDLQISDNNIDDEGATLLVRRAFLLTCP